MKRNLLLLGILVIILIALLGVSAFTNNPATPSPTPSSTSTAATQTATSTTRTHVSSVEYTCDKRRTIVADYYNGPAAPKPAPGQPPIPTGSVDVSIGNAPTTTLAQTISADGIRYANSDESLVFWSKGNTALVMRNNAMDLTYTNCTASTK